MDAEVTVKFKMKNVCDFEELDDLKVSFHELVTELIDEEGLFGLVEDNFEVVQISQVVE